MKKPNPHGDIYYINIFGHRQAFRSTKGDLGILSREQKLKYVDDGTFIGYVVPRTRTGRKRGFNKGMTCESWVPKPAKKPRAKQMTAGVARARTLTEPVSQEPPKIDPSKLKPITGTRPPPKRPMVTEKKKK